MLIAVLEDRVFRKRTKEAYKKRWTVRCFAYNKHGEVTFLRIQGTDAMGKRDHLETIGGGVENSESLEEAITREVKEEIGYTCEVGKKIGYIVDHYNLLNRETISTYFVVKLLDYVGGEKRTPEEKQLIQGLESYREDEIVKLLEGYQRRTVNELVQRRDLLAFTFYQQTK